MLLAVILLDGLSGTGGSGDGLFNNWYRLGCELPVLYGLVPIIDIGIGGGVGGRGSVVRGTSSHGEVGTVRNGKIVPEVTRIEQGCGCCNGCPGIPKMVVGDTPRSGGPTVVAQLESDVVLGDIVT